MGRRFQCKERNALTSPKFVLLFRPMRMDKVQSCAAPIDLTEAGFYPWGRQNSAIEAHRAAYNPWDFEMNPDKDKKIAALRVFLAMSLASATGKKASRNTVRIHDSAASARQEMEMVARAIVWERLGREGGLLDLQIGAHSEGNRLRLIEADVENIHFDISGKTSRDFKKLCRSLAPNVRPVLTMQPVQNVPGSGLQLSGGSYGSFSRIVHDYGGVVVLDATQLFPARMGDCSLWGLKELVDDEAEVPDIILGSMGITGQNSFDGGNEFLGFFGCVGQAVEEFSALQLPHKNSSLRLSASAHAAHCMLTDIGRNLGALRMHGVVRAMQSGLREVAQSNEAHFGGLRAVSFAGTHAQLSFESIFDARNFCEALGKKGVIVPMATREEVDITLPLTAGESEVHHILAAFVEALGSATVAV